MPRTSPPPAQQYTARRLIAEAARRFRSARLAYGHGTLNADDEAAWLTVYALGCPFEELAARLDLEVPPAAFRRAQQLFERRIKERIPAAYLTREAWLGDHRFYVDERVIVPRSYIAELLRERLQPWLPPRFKPKRILDLCTGSGCLAIVAAHTFPKSQVDGADISTAALSVARRNVREHDLTVRLQLKQTDLFEKLAGLHYDLILTNPPYVGVSAMRALPAEFRHEPVLALDGGNDGLDLVRRILKDTPQHLNDGGWLVMEVGHYRPRVERAFPRLPFIWAETSGGDDCVLLIQRESLLSAEPRARPSTAATVRRRRPTSP
ncbi:MAG: 50S ribosomal protein L3 N(5)-glutamine methyltransferase [Burkholderiales bacterium]